MKKKEIEKELNKVVNALNKQAMDIHILTERIDLNEQAILGHEKYVTEAGMLSYYKLKYEEREKRKESISVLMGVLLGCFLLAVFFYLLYLIVTL